MTVSAILDGRNKDQRNNQWIKPVGNSKNDNNTEAKENSYQILLKQAMMVISRSMKALPNVS